MKKSGELYNEIREMYDIHNFFKKPLYFIEPFIVIIISIILGILVIILMNNQILAWIIILGLIFSFMSGKPFNLKKYLPSEKKYKELRDEHNEEFIKEVTKNIKDKKDKVWSQALLYSLMRK
ncbi:MAG: hypothetical protein AABY22_25875 [Nanoarchaeota archaeon]